MPRTYVEKTDFTFLDKFVVSREKIMEEKKETKVLLGEESCMKIWQISVTSLRRGKPFTYNRVERHCNYCHKVFVRKQAAEKHSRTHKLVEFTGK
jgi:hypothetical protein